MPANNIGKLYENRGVFQLPPESNRRVRESSENVPVDYRQMYVNDPALQSLGIRPEIDQMAYYAINKPIVWTLERYITGSFDGLVYSIVINKNPRVISIANQGPGTVVFTIDGSLPDVNAGTTPPASNAVDMNQNKIVFAGASRTWTNMRYVMTIFPGYTTPVFVFRYICAAAQAIFDLEFQFTEIAGHMNPASAGV